MVRRIHVLLVVLGAALLVGAPGAWLLSQPSEQVGDVALLDRPDDRATGDQDGEVAADPRPAQPPPAPDPDGTGADTAAVPLDAGELAGPLRHQPVPDGLRIPALSVTAPVVPVALEDDGSMEIPTDVNVVGWYEPGVRPGDDGSAVLSGHVDSQEQGPGVLFDLRRLDVGDTIVTTSQRGEPMEWRVVTRTRYGKAELPIDDLFVRSGPPRLAVITCGGEFDAATGSYSDNVVVLAEPA